MWPRRSTTLGYRGPVNDGHHGGTHASTSTSRTSAARASTATAPLSTKAKQPRTASGYCVLDNDFAAAQFPDATPIDSLLVTAGHEFFHAVQFAYDYARTRG